MNTYFEFLPQEMLIEISMYLDRQSLIDFIKAHVESEHNFMYYKLADIYNEKIKDKLRIKKCILDKYRSQCIGRYSVLDISYMDSSTCDIMIIINTYKFDIPDYVFFPPSIVAHKSRYEEFQDIFDAKEITPKDLYIYIFDFY